MSHLYLLRHCITENNELNITQPVDVDVPCEREALSEFDKYCECIAKIGLLERNVAIFCSPAKRCVQTKAILVEKHKNLCNITEQYLPCMTEIDFGDFCGKPETAIVDNLSMTDFRNATINAYEDEDLAFEYPNGESFVNIEKRVNKAILAIYNIETSIAEPYDIVLIGHNRWFRHFMVQMGFTQPGNMFDFKFPHGMLFNTVTQNVYRICNTFTHC